MDSGNLRNALAKLHEELRRAQRVDPESRRLLQQLATDIERLMDQPAAHGQAKAPEPSHRHRLKEFEVKFEADHPALAATLREFVDLLAKAGM
jgi:Domain of unknown function (DUF4404)